VVVPLHVAGEARLLAGILGVVVLRPGSTDISRRLCDLGPT
jgi:hypothetical protein